MGSLLRNRIVLIGGGVIVVAALGYYAYAMLFSTSTVRKGPGDFGYELSSCQDEVFADLMEPADLVWEPNTVWYEGTAAKLKIGGTFTRVDMRTGKRRGFGYECAVRNRQVLNASVI